MADKYPNYLALSQDNVQGIDYDIYNRYGTGAYVTHIAIHGGRIEPPTTQLALYCAGQTGAVYAFSGKKPSGNQQLHITATNFDEPFCIMNVAKANVVVSWHGTSDMNRNEKVTYVGGLDEALGTLIRRELLAVGEVSPGKPVFPVDTPPVSISGESRANIANKGLRRAGVQLEITRSQREAFYKNGDLTGASIENPENRTPAFFSYCNAIMKAITAYLPAPLDVADAPSAALAIRPVMPVGTVSRAMKTPFAIDHSGLVANTTDEREMLLDRVHALASTLPGDRVYRATYGVPTTAALFAVDGATANQILQGQVRDAVSRWEPSAVVSAIVAKVNDSLGIVDINVQVSRADQPQAEESNTRTVNVKVGGAVEATPR